MSDITHEPSIKHRLALNNQEVFFHAHGATNNQDLFLGLNQKFHHMKKEYFHIIQLVGQNLIILYGCETKENCTKST